MKSTITHALGGFVAGLAVLAGITLLSSCGAHKKPVRLPDVVYRVSYFDGTCVKQPDGSYICKARFDPQEVRAGNEKK